MHKMLVWLATWLGFLLAAGAAQATPEASTNAPVPAVMACEALLTVDFTRDPAAPTALTGARLVAASDAAPEYCDVTGYVQPQVQFELRLPTRTWNGRYFQVGCGGFCGMISIQNCGDVLARDFAVAADNMGHVGDFLKQPLWGASPDARRDYGARSTHVTALAAKRILTAFYGKAPAFSYFRGCSTGGREGLMEAQHYPADFDGIIAGDPAFAGRLGAIANVWDAQHLFGPGDVAVFSPAALATLHRAAIATCDGVDGVKDGIISDPRGCRFDPAAFVCGKAPAGDCLTPAQAAAAAAVYGGPRNRAGMRLYPGGAMPGSEGAWGEVNTWTLPDGSLKFLMFKDVRPGFGYRDFDFDRDPPLVKAQVAAYDPVAPDAAPDLAAFHARGGRLILYHGWADQGVSPLGTLDYYGQVAASLGGMGAIRDWFRLFMVPGMFHCRGGNAPNRFDFMPAIQAWVEQGTAPDGVIATQSEGARIVRSRPLFAYPEIAVYDGKGDVNAPASWHAASPKAMPDDRIAWLWGPTTKAR